MDKQKVLEIIAKFAKVDVKTLTPDLDIKSALHLDSIDMFQIIMAVESAFNIKIKNEDLLGIKTIGDILSKIDNAK